MSERIMHGLRVSGSPIDPRRESHYSGGGPADRINVSIQGNVTANRIEYRVSCTLRLSYWTDFEDDKGNKIGPKWTGHCGEIYISRNGGGDVTEGGRKAIWKLLDAIRDDHCGDDVGARLMAKAEAAASAVRMANRTLERAQEQLDEARNAYSGAEEDWHRACRDAGIDGADKLAMVSEY